MHGAMNARDPARQACDLSPIPGVEHAWPECIVYHPPKLTEPRLVRCGDDWIVDVPAEKVAEAIAFSKGSGVTGFRVNAFTGATQQTIEDLLAMADPDTLVIAGALEVREIGSGLAKLVLGIRTRWPDSLSRSGVEAFTCMESGPTERLPRNVKHLGMHGFAARDLSPLQRFGQLETLHLTEAGSLESLDGLPMSLARLGLTKCRKLRDITALRYSHVRHFSAEMCPSLSKGAIDEARAWLEHSGNGS